LVAAIGVGYDLGLAATQSHVVDHVVRLVVSGTLIETTEEHPFWIAGKGWTRAANLSVGDGLITISGQTNFLEAVKRLHKRRVGLQFRGRRGTHLFRFG
jgi:hypothetical protein